MATAIWIFRLSDFEDTFINYTTHRAVWDWVTNGDSPNPPAAILDDIDRRSLTREYAYKNAVADPQLSDEQLLAFLGEMVQRPTPGDRVNAVSTYLPSLPDSTPQLLQTLKQRDLDVIDEFEGLAY